MVVLAAWFIYIATAGIPVKAENKDKTKNNWVKTFWFIYIATAGIPIKAENKDRTKNNFIKRGLCHGDIACPPTPPLSHY